MRTENSGGDSLARGLPRCQFRAAGSSVSQERWDKIWAEDKDETDRGNANTETSGNAGTESGKASSV